MESLRQSVKLKKRANPLEKIMNKLINNEKNRDHLALNEQIKSPNQISNDKKKMENEAISITITKSKPNVVISIGQL
jgi:hypothetical protein